MDYDDIINLPHHQSATRPHMSIHDRAAQFAPFATLTGHDDTIKETARLTDEKTELDEYEIADIDAKLQIIKDNLSDELTATITYFQPDYKKAGGAYLTKTGIVKKFDDYNMTLVFTDGYAISIKDITSVESDIVRFYEDI